MIISNTVGGEEREGWQEKKKKIQRKPKRDFCNF